MLSCVVNRRLVFVVGIFGVLCFCGGVVLGGVIHVPGDVGTIQGAIDLAVDGDEIIVDAGTYNEAIDLLGKAVFLHSAEGRDVTVIDGTRLDSSVVTMVNGEGLDTVIEGFTITGGTGANHGFTGGGLYLVDSSPTISDCLIKRNVIQYKYAGNGGGIYIDGSQPHIINCDIRGNGFEQPYIGFGGGIFSTNRSSPNIEYCMFVGNFSRDGAGIFSDKESTAMIFRCSFTGNSAWYIGGGIQDTEAGSTITGCLFSGNTARYGAGFAGGGNSARNRVVHIARCDFRNNTAIASGGGLWIPANNRLSAYVKMSDCSITDNSAETESGGGLFIFNSFDTAYKTTVSITDCLFARNHAATDGGGCDVSFSYSKFTRCNFTENTADRDGGGLKDFVSREMEINECNFSGNSSGRDGGGLYLYTEDAVHSNLIIQNNHADGNGGGLLIRSSSTLANALVINNTAAGDGGGILVGSSATVILSNFTVADNISTDGHGSGISFAPIFNHFLLLRNSIIRNGNGGIWGNGLGNILTLYNDIEGGGFTGDGVIDADPMFADRSNGDYRLRSGSPCIDAGANGLILFGSVIDLDGNARRVDDLFVTDTGQGKSPVVDMGAYEFQALVGPTLVVSPDPIIAGEKVVFTLLNGRSGSDAFLLYSLRGPGRVFVPSLNVVVDISHPLRVRGSKFTDEKGRARYVTRITENAKGIDIWFQGVEENVKTGVVLRHVE